VTMFATSKPHATALAPPGDAELLDSHRIREDEGRALVWTGHAVDAPEGDRSPMRGFDGPGMSRLTCSTRGLGVPTPPPLP
jgi:hypothetical protein